MNFESKPDVFISYNQADEEIARKIGTYLENKKIDKRNINVFFAPWNIMPASNFVNEIDDGLATAKFFVLVLSPDALEAEWPLRKELHHYYQILPAECAK